MISKGRVGTRAVREAVIGHEDEILRSLGIEPQSPGTHRRCPYPDHVDQNPSWRFVPSKRRAYCSCIERSDSVFDVVAKVRSCDFEGAKLYVAEVLGREDLIQSSSRVGSTIPGTDATSLLSPPAEQRDDRLAKYYLAFRLGIAPENICLPATSSVSWSNLPYFDPPTNGRGRTKPRRVGDYPCLIFETQAPDGRRHAQRIYVALDGKGKAQLGTDREGRQRQAKKSAKIADGMSRTGCCVLWGEQEAAPWLILAEGIETATALAQCYSDEIRKGRISIAAALSAAGMEAFEPWPATQRLTIAADRDEGGIADEGPAWRRGEKAARRLALKLHDRLEIEIALPGDAGEKIDFLDLFRRGGKDIVRSTLLAAKPFKPSDEELKRAATVDARNKAVAEIERLYPLPKMPSLQLVYRQCEGGDVKIHRVISKTDPRTGVVDAVMTPVSSPFGVEARLRKVGQAGTFGLRLVVQDMDGRRRSLDVERAPLSKRGAPEIMSRLWDHGLRIHGDGEAIIIQMLKAANPEIQIVTFSSPGWQSLADQDGVLFVTPGGNVIGSPAGFLLELDSSAQMPSRVAKSGTFEGWRTAAEAALTTPGCEHWILGLIAGFAGPILSLAGLDTCGINLSGFSSSGKSTAQRLAASAWSTPDIRKPGLCQTARTTDNAIEALAARSNGTILALDEVGHLHGKQLAPTIYAIAGGTGKRRMTAEASLRESHTWATFVLLSGELSLADHVERDGGEWSAGMAVRIADVDVSAVNRKVDPETLGRIAGIERHYGHAGPKFVEALANTGIPDRAIELRDQILKRARKLAGTDGDSALIRAAYPFAVLAVAGTLARELSIIPSWTDVERAVDWGWERFKTSNDSRALSPDERAIDQLQEFVARRWGVSIKPLSSESGLREAEGWFDDEAVYLPTSVAAKATGSTLKSQQVGTILKTKGLLARFDRNRCTVQWIPGCGKIRAFALKRCEFGRVERFLDEGT